MPMPPRITVEGGLGGAGTGFTAGAALTALAAGVVVVVAAVAGDFVSAGLLVVAAVAEAAAAAGLVSIGGAGLLLRPNIGDQAKPIRGARFILLSILFWFS